MNKTLLVLGIAILGVGGGCSDNANKRGVGAECTKDTDCTEKGQVCLTAFKGGYCGFSGCMHDTDCLTGSACVTDNGTNYCFLVCTDKVQCNDHRTAANESDCVSSLPFVDATAGRKVCRPPLSGTGTPSDAGGN